MSNSNRSGQAATGLAEQNDSAVGNAQGGNERADYSDANAAGDKGQPALVPNSTTVETVEANLQPGPEQQRQKADLQAQQDMAFYALLMVLATAATVLLTGAGIWLLKRTLDATLEAVRDTNKATKAMVDSNDLAEKGQYWQLRAYLSISAHANVRYVEANFGDGPQDYFGIQFKFENTGVTPARKAAVRHKVMSVPQGTYPLDWVPPDRIGMTIIGPKQSTVTMPLLIPLDMAARQWTDEEDIFFFAEVSYDDVFGKTRHITKHCFKASFMTEPTALFRGQDDWLKYFSLEPWKQWNEAT